MSDTLPKMRLSTTGRNSLSCISLWVWVCTNLGVLETCCDCRDTKVYFFQPTACSLNGWPQMSCIHLCGILLQNATRAYAEFLYVLGVKEPLHTRSIFADSDPNVVFYRGSSTGPAGMENAHHENRRRDRIEKSLRNLSTSAVWLLTWPMPVEPWIRQRHPVTTWRGTKHC